MSKKEDRSKLRAFKIVTKNFTIGTDLYVVIARNYAEAEDIYWKELNGYYEILSINEIEGTENVAYRDYNKTEVKEEEDNDEN